MHGSFHDGKPVRPDRKREEQEGKKGDKRERIRSRGKLFTRKLTFLDMNIREYTPTLSLAMW